MLILSLACAYGQAGRLCVFRCLRCLCGGRAGSTKKRLLTDSVNPKRAIAEKTRLECGSRSSGVGYKCVDSSVMCDAVEREVMLINVQKRKE